MPLSPPYDVQPVTEDDIDACMESAGKAFQHDPLVNATFPPHLVDPQDPDEQLRFRKRRLRLRIADHGPVFKIADPDKPGVIAAWASWTAPQKLDPDGGDKKMMGAPDPNERPNSADAVVFDEQIRCMKEAKERLFGENKDFWYLSGLSCHPDYQGKGLGAALVRWGLDQAAKDGIPVYLEATPSGRFLYKKLGFVEVDEIDMSRFIPNGGQYKVAIMLKKPSNQA